MPNFVGKNNMTEQIYQLAYTAEDIDKRLAKVDKYLPG